jgi:hypothetical protein
MKRKGNGRELIGVSLSKKKSDYTKSCTHAGRRSRGESGGRSHKSKGAGRDELHGVYLKDVNL